MKTIVESAKEISDLSHARKKIYAFNQENSPSKLDVLVKVKIEFTHFTSQEVVEMEIPKHLLYYNGTKDLHEVLSSYINQKRLELSEFILSGIVESENKTK